MMVLYLVFFKRRNYIPLASTYVTGYWDREEETPIKKS